MNSKKAITLLVLVTLIIGLVPFVNVQGATSIAITEIQDDEELTLTEPITVTKGTVLYIVGEGVTAGATVNVYWDNAFKETFSDGEGKIASGTAKKTGSFSIKVTVPEGVAGDHYIWVKDVSTGATYGGITADPNTSNVVMDQKLSLSATSGLPGDKITVTGYGFGYNEDDDEGYDITLAFTNAYLIDITFTPAVPVTNSLGTWTTYFTVPDETYGDYLVSAEDELTNYAEKVFSIWPSISLNVEEGPVGTVVQVTGRGFEYGEEVAFGEVTLDGLDVFLVTEPVEVRTGGRVTVQFVVPTIDADDDPYTVWFTDGVWEATADFTVNGEAEIKATPTYGAQGTMITVEGWNFTKISNKDVVVELSGAGAKTFKTDSKGYFKGSYQIPAVPTGTDLSLTATQEDYFIDADTTVRVGVMLVIVTPESGASGTVVSITGVGFKEGMDYEATIGDKAWFEGTVGAGGAISVTGLYVPSLEAGTYVVKITELDADGDPAIDVTSSFTVTANTVLELDPVNAANNYEITIEGYNYGDDDTYTDLVGWDFVLYNTTYDEGWILSIDFADFEIEEGDWTAAWTVYDSETLDLGIYTLNVTDPYGLSAEVVFEIVEPIVSVTPRKSSYGIGETVAFNVKSTFTFPDSYFKIYDSGNNLYWQTDALDTGVWVKVGTERQVPYYAQTSAGNPMILPPDAPLGTWTWKYYVYDVEEDEWVVEKDGVFEVTPAAEEILGQQIEDLNAAVTSLQTDISTVSTEVAGVKTQITNAINAANAAVQAANAATQAVNAVAQTANAASTAATNAANAATEAKNAANGLTTLVYGAIGASLVAALAAIVSLMQISRRIAG